MSDVERQELEAWLETRWMGRFVGTLVENGYPSLAELKKGASEAKASIIALFDKSGHRLKMRLLLEELLGTDLSTRDRQESMPSRAPPPVPDLPPPVPPVPAGAALPPMPVDDSSDSSDEGPRRRGSSSSDDDLPPPQAVPPMPNEMPPIPDSDSSDDDRPPQTAVPALPPLPDSSDSSDDEPPHRMPPVPGDDNRGGRANTDFRQKKAGFEKKADEPEEKPIADAAARKKAFQSSHEFKSKAKSIGASLKFGLGAPGGMLAPGQKPPTSPRDEEEEAVANMPSTSEILTSAEKEGVLDKRGMGMFNKAWKSRHHVLRGKELFWMKTRQDPTPAGRLDLCQKGVIIRTTDDPRIFEVATNKKTWQFRALGPNDAQGWARALRAAQVRSESVQSLHSGSNDGEEDVSLDDKQIEKLMDMLKIGRMFIKYKRKKGKDRMIWFPEELDRILWGDLGKKNVKGFIMVSDIQRVSDGCFGARNDEAAFTIISDQRTLELEAPSKSEKRAWVKGIQILIDNRQ